MSPKKFDFNQLPVKKSKKPTTAKKKTAPKKSSDKSRIAELEAQLAEKEAELAKLKTKEQDNHVSIDDLVARGIELTLQLNEVKEWYKERDEIVEQLLETGETSFEHEGTTLVLEDNFATKNKQWKSVPFSQYELQIIESK